MVGSPMAAEVVEHVETRVSEGQLEEDDLEQWIEAEGCEDGRAKEIGHKLHNLLLNLTTGEVDAVVRRWEARAADMEEGCARP